MPNFSSTQTERPRFYEQQYLGAGDLSSVVDYGRVAAARHDLGAHTWGIAAGLQIVEQPSKIGGPLEVYVEPGYAWDGFGRAISLLAPLRVPGSLFDSLPFEASDNGKPPGRLIQLWIGYCESVVGGPAAGFEVCNINDPCNRTIEGCQLIAGAFPDHSSHDAISVGGYAIDARDVLARFNIPGPTVAGVVSTATLDDESVPYQSLLVDALTRWLVPIGVVRWLPTNGSSAGGFQPRVESTDPNPLIGPRDLTQNERMRRYIGVVANTINAPGNVIRLRNRTSALEPDVWSKDLVWMEGSARVAGDFTLLGGKLTLRDSRYDDRAVPMSLARVESNLTKGRDLLLQLGATENGTNRFVVGPMIGAGDAAAVHESFVVKDNGNVGIGEPNPDRPLVVRAHPTDPNVVGLQDSTGVAKWTMALNVNAKAGLHFREGKNGSTRLFVGESGNIGIGTVDPFARLHVSDTRVGASGALSSHVAIFENASDASSSNVLALKLSAEVNSAGSNFLTFFAGARAVGAFESNDSGTLSYNAVTADVAEWMPRVDGEQPMVAGDVVGIHGGFVSRKLDGAERVMVVSTAPMVLGNRPPDDERGNYEQIAFLGRTSVRVRGPVKRGDYILSSGARAGAVAVSPSSLTVGDVSRIVAIAWEDGVGSDMQNVRCGVGLPASAHVWSIVAAELQRLGALAATQASTVTSKSASVSPTTIEAKAGASSVTRNVKPITAVARKVAQKAATKTAPPAIKKRKP
ncbi:MAG: hypothetical protein ABJB74_02975 [Gemmatimonas sp.]